MESRDLSFSINWDGTDSTNQPVPSGVYLYQLRAGKQTLAQKKMMLLK
jgi:flagellar hook assembly protein FlgD